MIEIDFLNWLQNFGLSGLVIGWFMFRGEKVIKELKTSVDNNTSIINQFLLLKIKK